MAKKQETIPAGAFKQHCLALIDQVNRTKRPIVISKRGKPLVKMVPLDTDEEIEARILDRLRSGEGGMLVDEKTFLRPTSEIAGWRDP